MKKKKSNLPKLCKNTVLFLRVINTYLKKESYNLSVSVLKNTVDKLFVLQNNIINGC